MKQTFKETDIALITTAPVLNTYENEAAYLHAAIEVVRDDQKKREKHYKVRTDYVGYREVQVPQLDEKGETILNDDGSSVLESKEQLIWLEQKQDWSLQKITYAEIDAFVDLIAEEIPEGLTRTERDAIELAVVFLKERQKSPRWGVAPEKWRIRTNEDLLRNKE